MSDHDSTTHAGAHHGADPVVVAMFKELAQVQGQLTAITSMIATNHDSTNKRIDDLRHSMETRMERVEERVETLESNERSTAIRVAGAAAGTSALTLAGIELVRFLSHRGG